MRFVSILRASRTTAIRLPGCRFGSSKSISPAEETKVESTDNKSLPQSLNRATTWSVSQQSKQIATTGPRY